MNRLTALLITAATLTGYAATQPADAALVEHHTTTTTSSDTGTAPDLALGARGDQVTALQQTFSTWGYTITVDGWFGPQTERVVRSWQRSNGLHVDGIVGEQTRASLNAATAPAPTTPATRAPAPIPDPPRSVEQIIRDVWPDDVEDWAVTIAWRESRHIPTARNYCCHGLFQMHWNVHRGWLDDYGVTSVEQLYDAETNARVALALYQRNGRSPWSQTDY